MLTYQKKSITPGRRFQNLVKPKIKNRVMGFFSFNLTNKSGRNNSGQITVNHKGGRNKFKYVVKDRQRQSIYLPGFIVSFIKNSWAQPFFALIKYANGALSYITVPLGLAVGSIINLGIYKLSYLHSKNIGNLVSIGLLKTNDIFYSGFYKNKNYFFYAKAAGTFCKIRYKVQSEDFFILTIPSGFKKKLPIDSFVFLGRNSNIFHQKTFISNAGSNRRHGIRPTVRGVAMNPVDHPHGGRTKTNQPEVSPWGWVAKRGY